MANNFPYARLIFLGVLVHACGSDNSSGGGDKQQQAADIDTSSISSQAVEFSVPWENEPLQAERNTVMVIDSGFDVSHPIFKGKIKAAYTKKCQPNSKATPLDYSSKSALKKSLLQAFQHPPKDCQYHPGITFKKSPQLAEIAKHRNGWNKLIIEKKNEGKFDKTGAENLEKILKGFNANGKVEYTYHGTSTAGAIAYKNPGVRLVFIQEEFANPAIKQKKKTSCPSQKDVDNMNTLAELMDDPEVKASFIATESPSEKQLNDIVTQHKVKFVNISAGPLVTKTIIKEFTDGGCDKKLTQAYHTAGNVYHQKARRLEIEKQIQGNSPFNDILVVQASGNEGARMDSTHDARHCAKDPNAMLVGSISREEKLSKFSNWGACVDAYHLGEGIILPVPDGFYTVLDGTSFSAPLVVRLLSLSMRGNESPGELKALLKSKSTPTNHYVRVENVPSQIIFQSKPKPSTTFSSAQKDLLPVNSTAVELLLKH